MCLKTKRVGRTESDFWSANKKWDGVERRDPQGVPKFLKLNLEDLIFEKYPKKLF